MGLRWKDIDFEKGCLYVRQTLNHDGKTFLKGLRQKQVFVPLAFQIKL
ncbi:hypothetical protein OH784_13790 [Ectobacillus funiculus]